LDDEARGRRWRVISLEELTIEAGEGVTCEEDTTAVAAPPMTCIDASSTVGSMTVSERSCSRSLADSDAPTFPDGMRGVTGALDATASTALASTDTTSTGATAVDPLTSASGESGVATEGKRERWSANSKFCGLTNKFSCGSVRATGGTCASSELGVGREIGECTLEFAAEMGLEDTPAAVATIEAAVVAAAEMCLRALIDGVIASASGSESTGASTPIVKNDIRPGD
jgi:hypothetical protein